MQKVTFTDENLTENDRSLIEFNMKSRLVKLNFAL